MSLYKAEEKFKTSETFFSNHENILHLKQFHNLQLCTKTSPKKFLSFFILKYDKKTFKIQKNVSFFNKFKCIILSNHKITINAKIIKI